MRILTPIFAIVLLATTISAQTKVVPILDLATGGLLGGARNGQWVKDRATAATQSGEGEYRVIGWTNGTEGQMVRGPKPAVGEPCDDFFFVEAEPKLEKGIALGTGVNWNPVPRVPVAISLTDPTYTAVVGSIVRARGIRRPKVEIRQAYRVDLDNDGTEEVILAATYREGGGISPSAAPGEYSFVLLRKLVRGKVKNILIGGEFYPRSVQFGAINEYEIAALADLNGDGKMELVMGSHYYEGAGSSVYEIRGAIAKEVLTSGCGV